jgi:hypothetical protein
MLNLTVGNSAVVAEDSDVFTSVVVKEIGKRTVKVEDSAGNVRKFVLSDGRESGKGFKCAHLLDGSTATVATAITLSDKFMEAEFDSSAAKSEVWFCEDCGTDEVADQDNLNPSYCYDCAVERSKAAQLEDPEVAAFNAVVNAE